MKVTAIRSDAVYGKLLEAPQDKKDDIYRYELMMPFEKKWACYHVPMKPATPGGYDVVYASGMLGHIAPKRVDETQRKNVELISSDELWNACQQSITQALEHFEAQGIVLPVQEYIFTILLAEPESPYIALSDGYCGEGGIPGYITAWLLPNEKTLGRLPAALAHEANHNVRFQFIKWRDDITLGEMLVSEGLAENYSVSLHGEDTLGPWVTKTDAKTLEQVIKPTMRGALGVQGLNALNAWLYGDEMAVLQGFEPVGMPYCAGYACGYHLIRHYLKKTGRSIAEATILPAEEILKETEDFWK